MLHQLLEVPLLSGRRDGAEAGGFAGGGPSAFLLEDVGAQVRAIGADIDIVGSFDHGPDLA